MTYRQKHDALYTQFNKNNKQVISITKKGIARNGGMTQEDSEELSACIKTSEKLMEKIMGILDIVQHGEVNWDDVYIEA